MRRFFVITTLLLPVAFAVEALLVIEGEPIAQFADQNWQCKRTSGLGIFADSLVCELHE